MTYEKYYGKNLSRLKYMEQILLDSIRKYPIQKYPNDIEPILYCKSRIKKPDSMICKLKQHGLSTDVSSALTKMHDAIGIRVVCSFLEDVYKIANWLSLQEEFTVIKTKDYIAYPKPNGYRSLHLIVSFGSKFEKELFAEIQLRTIAIDFWASLEHQMKYKKNIKHEKIIQNELKRCADEIASLDLSMQTICDLILNDKWD